MTTLLNNGVGWGGNYAGQIGNNTTIDSYVPTGITGNIIFQSLSGGGNHTLGLDQNGTIWSWGANVSGQLGLGFSSFTIQLYPVQIVGVPYVIFQKIAAGESQSLALDNTGKVWTWGNSSSLGRPNINNSTPDGITGYVGSPIFIDIATTSNTSSCMALDNTGKIWGWGNVSSLGFGGIPTNPMIVPTMVTTNVTGVTFVQVKLGNDYCIALDQQGDIWSCGTDTGYSLGNQTAGSTSYFQKINGVNSLIKFNNISAGNYHNLAKSQNSFVYSWGNNNNGQLGVGTIGGPTGILQKITSLGRNIVDISCNGNPTGFGPDRNYCLALDDQGQIWSWGGYSMGRLGDNSLSNKPTPSPIVGITGYKYTFVNTGANQALAIIKEMGDTGPDVGPEGPRGPTGETGEMGPTGATGVTGAIGDDGPVTGGMMGWDYKIDGLLDIEPFNETIIPLTTTTTSRNGILFFGSVSGNISYNSASGFFRFTKSGKLQYPTLTIAFTKAIGDTIKPSFSLFRERTTTPLSVINFGANQSVAPSGYGGIVTTSTLYIYQILLAKVPASVVKQLTIPNTTDSYTIRLTTAKPITVYLATVIFNG